MILEIGKCPVCNDAFMDKGKPLANHRQIKVQLTNGFEIYLAVCRKHELTDELLNEVTDATLKFLSDETPEKSLKDKYSKLSFVERL